MSAFMCDPRSLVLRQLRGTPCPACEGTGVRPMAGGTCRFCAGSAISLFSPLPAALQGFWGFLIGIQEHSEGRRRDDSPFPRWTHDDVAWRAGWARAERDAVAEDRREKLAAERMVGELV